MIRYSDEAVRSSAALLEANPDLYLAWNYRKRAFLHRWLKAGRIPAGTHTSTTTQPSAGNRGRGPAAASADDGDASGSASAPASSTSSASNNNNLSSQYAGDSTGGATSTGEGDGVSQSMGNGNPDSDCGREKEQPERKGEAVEGSREQEEGRACSHKSNSQDSDDGNRRVEQVTTEEKEEEEEEEAGEVEAQQARLALEEAELRVVCATWGVQSSAVCMRVCTRKWLWVWVHVFLCLLVVVLCRRQWCTERHAIYFPLSPSLHCTALHCHRVNRDRGAGGGGSSQPSATRMVSQAFPALPLVTARHGTPLILISFPLRADIATAFLFLPSPPSPVRALTLVTPHACLPGRWRQRSCPTPRRTVPGITASGCLLSRDRSTRNAGLPSQVHHTLSLTLPQAQLVVRTHCCSSRGLPSCLLPPLPLARLLLPTPPSPPSPPSPLSAPLSSTPPTSRENNGCCSNC